MTREHEVPVLIAGGGPVGLVLALELEHRGVDAILLERNSHTTRHPKMDVTNGRRMEHFRRLGVIDDIRAKAVPSDHPMSVVWCTQVGSWELARFDYPSIDWGRDIIRYVNDGTLPLEPDMRISQVILEPVLKDFLEKNAGGVRKSLMGLAKGLLRENRPPDDPLSVIDRIRGAA